MEKAIFIYSKIENINLIEKLIDEISDEVGINSEVYGKVLIATVEAVNNSIIHGNKQDETKKVNVSFNVKHKQMLVFIEDEGTGFNSNIVPDPTIPENIRNIHGRGVYLIQHLADDVIFHGNGNKVELKFNI
ncbi:MAG: ATP-binding protein [Bacteroidales bacterium]|nr:ATP-binding protein [Bacteroidales bacterium]